MALFVSTPLPRKFVIISTVLPSTLQRIVRFESEIIHVAEGLMETVSRVPSKKRASYQITKRKPKSQIHVQPPDSIIFKAFTNMPHSTVARTASIDGHEVDVASLETINFGRLTAKEPAEVEKLLNACQMPGFFYLDFQNGPAKELIADVPEIYAVSKQYFDQPQEVKMKDYRAEQDRGQDRGWVPFSIHP